MIQLELFPVEPWSKRWVPIEGMPGMYQRRPPTEDELENMEPSAATAEAIAELREKINRIFAMRGKSINRGKAE